MNTNTKTACFTGHRPNKLFGYERDNYLQLVQILTDAVESLYTKGYTRFITGGAQGADQLAFWAINRAKKKYPDIQSLVYVPFRGQQRVWQMKTLFGQEEYYLMLSKADTVLFLEETPTASMNVVPFLYNRNHRMVDDSDLVIGIYHEGDFREASKGGTAECLRYADKNNKPIEIINPLYF